MENGIDWKALAGVNANSMSLIANDTKNIASRLKKTPFSDDFKNKFKSNVIESTFFISAFTIAAKSFNKMLADKENDPTCEKRMSYYFLKEIEEIMAIEGERDKLIEENPALSQSPSEVLK